MTSQSATIKVWDLPTRVFHWSVALSFAGAYITSEGERLRAIHVMFGYTLLALMVFRVVWGLIGTRHARFSAFLAGPGRIKTYLQSLLARNPEHHVGHNPAGALAIVLLIVLGLTTACSGLALYNDIGPEWLEDFHPIVANTMLAVVAIHVLGVVVSSYLHRENLARAMVTGYKRGAASEGIPGTRRVLGILMMLALVGFWVGYGFTSPGVLNAIGPNTSAEHTETDDD